jgi:hypothetical protein
MKKLPVGIKTEKVKYCDLDSWEMCLINIELNGKEQIFVIEKYQNHYGSIKWDSIFSNKNEFDKKEVILKIREKYPLILINEDLYIDEFKDYIRNNPKDYHYYKNHYVQEVDKIISDLKWLELSRYLKIRD